MYCQNCGADFPEYARFCKSCGAQQMPLQAQAPHTGASRIGYSSRINDPAFAQYIKKSNRWSGIFSMILAVAAIIGFTVAGESGVEGMSNPEALYIGLGIGGMFIVIALFQIVGRKRSRTWDGAVVDKTVQKKSRRKSTGSDDNDYYIQHYTEYMVIIRADSGKLHRLVAEDDDTVFNYYRIGDRIRHHAGLNSYEKYDKSKDSIIFCSACATLCEIGDEQCFRCKCPLLK